MFGSRGGVTESLSSLGHPPPGAQGVAVTGLRVVERGLLSCGLDGVVRVFPWELVTSTASSLGAEGRRG